MAFAQLQGISPELQQARHSVLEQSRVVGLDPATLTPITGVFKWEQLLRAAQNNDGTAPMLMEYMRAMGYVPESAARLSRNQQVDLTTLGETRSKIITDIVSGAINETTFTQSASESLKALSDRYPELTKGQTQLLQSIVSQEIRLEKLDVSQLQKQFPFPITQYNFFGRFLAGGDVTPQRAARHLQLANPFLIRMRSLLEGLSNNRLNFLHVDISSASDRQNSQSGQSGLTGPLELKKRAATHRAAAEILHAVIDNSADFYGAHRPNGNNPLVCIPVPKIPDVRASHIDKRKTGELAVAVFDWLLYGKRDHPLLHSKALQSGTETLAKQYSKQLAEKKQALRSLEDRSPQSFGSARERKRAQREEKRLQTSIDRLENRLEDINRERSAITPIIRQLEENALTTSAIRQFRAQINHAETSGAKIVFSLLGGSANERPGSLLDFLDLAVNAPRSLSKNPAVNLLRNSSILLNDDALGRVRSGRIQTPKSVVEQQVRKFHVEADEINVSAKFLIAGILPRKEDPKLALLIDAIATYAPPPGVQTDRELVTLVQKASGKANPQASDYLEYTFERLPSMSQDQLFVLLGKLHELGISKVSPRVQDLSRERFKHRTDVLPSFRVYSANYRPNKLGSAPEIFADRATFETYLNSGIDALGMAPELRQIERHLLERGIVAVVDGTNYHPELNAEIGVTGDKLEKDDAERTTEVWGDYVRPSERAIRGLSLKLIEGDVSPELRNASLMGIVKPNKVSQVMQKIIKKFYGIDIDINPDLSTINQVLADLKLHDDNTVLVVDARSITDMEQYREFVSLLERYQIKIILRTREPFPGVPQVNIQPFLEDTVPDRIMQDAERLQKKLGLAEPIGRSVVEFATRQVQRCRQPQADPLNLTLQVLHGAAAHARLYPDKKVTEQDVVVALPPIFHLPDGEQMRLRLDAIDSFMKRAPLLVLGQDKAIRSIGDKVKSHILGMRDPTRPLTLLIPGPTGVGKTELMMCIARICDIPFFMVEGAEFSEEHTVSRLVGSPSGYVGPDEGILYTFLKENTMGLVFIDEIEKMHPSVYQALMNFFDKATLTAGNGKTVTRPGFIIVGASNAGADRLTRTLDTREIKEILSEAFVDRMGRPRPELVRRFDPIVMPAIEEESFKKMLRASVDAIGSRPGFINANLRLVEFDDAAVELLYNKSKQVCEYNERSLQKLGFRPQEQVADSSGLYYDMRHVSRALDELAGESLRDLAITQYQNGRHAMRGASIPVRLVGDLNTQRIELVPIAS